MVTALRSAEEIQVWLVSYVANLLGIDSEEVDVRTPFERYGLDSTAAAGLSGDLGQWLGIKLADDVILDHPTIEALTQFVNGVVRSPGQKQKKVG